MDTIRNWLRRYLGDPQVVGMLLVLIALTLIIILLGRQLAPAFAALIIAYLLSGLVRRLRSIGLPHLAAVIIVFLVFMTALVLTMFWLVPLFFRQLAQLVQQMPAILSDAQALLLRLPEQFPGVIMEQQVTQLVSSIGTEIMSSGQRVLAYSVSSVFVAITIIVYLILVPLMVFFMIRDQERILAWLAGFLPRDRQLTDTVLAEINDQIGNYVRGKVWEILIVGSVTYATFTFLGVQYTLLLAVATGLSVLIPFVGVAVVTLPVAAVAYFQFGISAEFYYVLIAYGVIQLLDGNLLAPLLFSEVVNLHPIAIVVAILVFGGLWGFWGVFFAIPLATVVNAILRAWPRPEVFANAAGQDDSAQKAT
ncbi:MAG: AI-2E family transporter [Gammaproteobacteria bacterium]|nr:AI-2E family transporter [Gammaproteobacteria bacterium]TVQ48283.1 MAG: AI-2E family transporter [Gammaproteobacteria bacterium]